MLPDLFHIFAFLFGTGAGSYIVTYLIKLFSNLKRGQEALRKQTNTRIDLLLEQISDNERRVRELRTDLSTAETRNDRLEEQQLASEERWAKERAIYTVQILKLETEIERVKLNSERVTTERDQLKEENKQLKVEVYKLNQKINDLYRQLNTLKQLTINLGIQQSNNSSSSSTGSDRPNPDLHEI